MPEIPWTPDPTDRSCTLDRIESVAFTPMPAALRNQLITRTYGDLGQAMVDLLGPDDITWCVVGQWASHTIGDFLDLPMPFVGPVITRHFADGNRDVFADIARAQAIFLETVGRAHEADDDIERAWRECRRRLRLDVLEPPGRVRGDAAKLWDSINDDPPGSKRPNQRALVLGFEAYKRALTMERGEARQRTILLGNILLALHEQRHLTLAISLGFRAWLRTITRPSWPLTTTRDWMNRDPGGWRLAVEHWWIRTATRFFIRLDLGADRIRVSSDVPSGDSPVPFDPLAAADVPRRQSNRPSNDEMLAHFYERLGIDGRPATCWNSLSDRMAYIAALFVHHQRSDRWFEGPGVLARAELHADLDEKAASVVPRRAGGTVDPTPAPSPIPGPLLDDLRQSTTSPPVTSDPTLADLLNDKHEMLAAVGEDLDRRIDTLLGDTGLWSNDTLDRSHAIFERWDVLMLMALLFRSLPDAYAAASGVKVIGTVSRLETDPFRRAGETAHFVREVLGDRPAWNRLDETWDNEVYRSIAGLRALHSIVSERLVADGWDSSVHGLPINQEDVVGTALSFAVPFLDLAEHLGVSLDRHDRDALVRFWLGIGHLLGAPIEAITVPVDAADVSDAADGPLRRLLDADEAAALAGLIRQRHHARSVDGVRLTEALIEGVADGFPRRMRWLVRGWMSALGDPNTIDLLLVSAGRRHRRAALLAAVLRGTLRFPPTRPLTRFLLDRMGTRWLRPFFDEGSARPYRRPRRANEAGPAALTPEFWPAGCGADDELGAVTPVASRRARARARRSTRRRRRFRARS